MMRVCVVGSGSKGNCTVVSNGKAHLLIDCGLSARRLLAALAQMEIDPHGLSAVFISHEHTDHIYGINTFFKKHSVPLLLSEGTTLPESVVHSDIPRSTFRLGETLDIDGIAVTPFPIPHDAANPCGFSIQTGEAVLAHVTDVGYLTEVVRQRVREATCLVMESNHDEEMLKVGPYPWNLKQRVLGKLGHLSNRSLANFLLEDFDGVARTLVLAHLSQQNNHPELARHAAEEALNSRFGKSSARPEVLLASQTEPTPILHF